MNRKYLVAIGIVAVMVVALVVLIPMLLNRSSGSQAAVTTAQAVQAPPLAPGATMPANHPTVAGMSGQATDATASATAALDGIVKAAETAYNADTKNIVVVLALGEAYFQAQQLADATRLFNEALVLQAGNPDAQAGLAMVDYANGDQPKAEAALQQIAQANPKNQTALYDLAIIYFSSNQRDKAKATWQQVVAVDGSSTLGQMAKQFVDLMTARDASTTTSGT
jgi:cytochrome c-type biogenesis protein CcmH/NrfG